MTAFGHYRDGGVLLAQSVTPDALAEGPAAYFDGGVGVVLVEAYAGLGGDGRLRLGRGWAFPVPPGVASFSPRHVVVELNCRGAIGGGFIATAVQGSGGSGPAGTGRGGTGGRFNAGLSGAGQPGFRLVPGPSPGGPGGGWWGALRVPVRCRRR